MKHSVTFPASAGQYAGTHFFATNNERSAFIERALLRGVDCRGVAMRHHDVVECIKRGIGPDASTVEAERTLDWLLWAKGVHGNDAEGYRIEPWVDIAASYTEALRTIVANASSVQMDPQWAVYVARDALARAKGETK
jgi:hypothetical protein